MMELGTETFRQRMALDLFGESDCESRPDWHALKSRFAAAFSARRELSANPALSGPAMAGSFDADSARCLGTYEHALVAVNPTALANGKPDGRISDVLAGEPTVGDRG